MYRLMKKRWLTGVKGRIVFLQDLNCPRGLRIIGRIQVVRLDKLLLQLNMWWLRGRIMEKLLLERWYDI